MQAWVDAHPFLIFVLGMMSLLTINTLFIALGGGYKKYPLCDCHLNSKK